MRNQVTWAELFTLVFGKEIVALKKYGYQTQGIE
jgi:hypothetical protein